MPTSKNGGVEFVPLLLTVPPSVFSWLEDCAETIRQTADAELLEQLEARNWDFLAWTVGTMLCHMFEDATGQAPL
jgi:hypothetical protein